MKFLQSVWYLTAEDLCVVIISRYLFCQSLYCDNQQVMHLMKLLYLDCGMKKAGY